MEGPAPQVHLGAAGGLTSTPYRREIVACRGLPLHGDVVRRRNGTAEDQLQQEVQRVQPKKLLPFVTNGGTLAVVTQPQTAGQGFMPTACMPITSTEVPFCESFLRHSIEQTRGYHFKESHPMNSSNYGALCIYEIKEPDVLLRHYPM